MSAPPLRSPQVIKNNHLNKARIIAAVGRSDGGKSTFVKRLLRTLGNLPLFIIDPMHEYHGGIVCTSMAEVIKAFSRKQRPRCVVFRPSENEKVAARQFNLACRIAFTLGDLVFLVEELKLFTTPNKAPHWWSRLSLQGRHRGIVLIGTSQRPAHIDKDFLGNCTEIRAAGGFSYVEDAKKVASAMPGVTYAELIALPLLHFIHCNKRTGTIERGVLTFPKK